MRNAVVVSFTFLLLYVLVSATKITESEVSKTNGAQTYSYYIKYMEFIWNHLGYQHVWPEMEFGWKIIIGTLIGILGAAFGSVGGVGGGGIFVPMLILIIGFDPKSTIAISKCMVTGAAISAVFFCLNQKHPTLDIPVIDYDLMLLIQPTLMLGISIGVILSVIFADWMITVLLVILCLGTSIRAFFKGAETWKMETIMKEVNLQESLTWLTYCFTPTLYSLFNYTNNSDLGFLFKIWKSQKTEKLSESTATLSGGEEYKYLPGGPDGEPEKETKEYEVSIIDNIYWKEFVLTFAVWLAYVVLQIARNYTVSCTVTNWILILSQIPICIGFYLYQAIALYQGRSAAGQHTRWPLHHLFLASVCSLLAGIVGGLLGTGSGFVMGPLFLEVGIVPQVASATATFGMMYSASLSVTQYYLLNRFPVPYALYLTLVAAIAAYLGQHIIDKLVKIFQRASLIIFVLALTIFVSAIALGGVGISSMILRIQRHEYMGFDDFCKSDA